MNAKSRKNSNNFDAAAMEYHALALMRARREAGATWRELGEAIEVDPSWVSKWDKGEISDPGIHRIGRVIERLS